jgi:hypothetical protein
MAAARSFSVWGAIKGLVATAIVFLLFENLQAISDLAPASIKNSDIPGLFGVPIALLSLGWFTVIPIWFLWEFMANMRKDRFVWPRSFILGAFVGLCIGFPILEVLSTN